MWLVPDKAPAHMFDILSQSEPGSPMSSISLASVLMAIAFCNVVPSFSQPTTYTESTQNTAAEGEPQLSPNKKAALNAQRRAELDSSEDNLFLYASSLMKIDYPSAEKIYRFGIGKYPDSVRLHAGLSSALWAQGRLDEGAAELYRAAEIDPDDPHPLEFLVATGHVPASLSKKVSDRLRNLHQRYPHDGLILFDYEMAVSNRCCANDPVPDDFVPTLQEAIRLTPQLPEAHFQLSLVYEQRGEYSKELQALRRTVQLAPKDEHYRYNLAMLYKRMGNTEGFQSELSAFLKLHNSPPTATH